MTETVDIAVLSGIDQLRLGMTGGLPHRAHRPHRRLRTDRS